MPQFSLTFLKYHSALLSYSLEAICETILKIFMFYELMFCNQFSKSRNKTGVGTLYIIIPD